ncbi:hypothetical protein ACFL2Q_10770 [Thermodesulfobacteriota bacterium]
MNSTNQRDQPVDAPDRNGEFGGHNTDFVDRGLAVSGLGTMARLPRILDPDHRDHSLSVEFAR